MLVDSELVAVVAIETILRADPDEPLAVLQNGGDHALRESLRERNVFELYPLI